MVRQYANISDVVLLNPGRDGLRRSAMMYGSVTKPVVHRGVNNTIIEALTTYLFAWSFSCSAVPFWKYPSYQGGSNYSFSAITMILFLSSGGNCLILCGAESHLKASLT